MKKRLWWVVCAVFGMQALLLINPLPASAAGNLINNPSAEVGTVADTDPAGWYKNKWGQNTATFTYKKNDGYQSARSVRVQVSNFVSGDAKWFFEPVAVNASSDYTFSNFYKANVKTKVVAVSYDQSNTPTYFDVATNVAASSTAWKELKIKIKTLPTTKKLTVFHIIERNGWLQIDTAYLSKDDLPSPPLVPNASHEEAASQSQPRAWQSGSWGTNTPQFEYMNEGRTGNRSVKLTVSNYQDGDAKWFFDPQPLEKGKDYRFSAWYKTNTIPHVVAQFTRADGSSKYFGLPRPEPNGSTNWQEYSDTFTVPQDAQSVTVFFYLANNGWLQTDDYSIVPHQISGFARPLVSLTFDDGFEENVNTVLPRLNAKGFKSTHCYATQYVEGVEGQPQNVLLFRDSGHEVCSHSVTHPALSQLPLAQLTHELTHSKQYLESIVGSPVVNFASPYGDYNAQVNTEIKKYYRSHRTVDEGYNSKDNFNAYRIRVQNMQVTTSLAEFQGWVEKAKADKTWLVLVYHRVTSSALGQFDTIESDFAQQMDALQASGVTVKTYNAALDEIQPQL